MKKKIIAVILTTVLTASLLTGFACSKRATGSDEKNLKSSTKTEQAVEKDSTGTSADAEDLVEFTGNGDTGASTTEGVNVDLSVDVPKKAYEEDFDKSDADAVITLDKTGIKVDGSGAKADGATLTITDAGVYFISGALEDGSIVIDNKNDENIRLVLDGADITTKSGSCISVENAKNVFITLKKGSENSLICDDADSSAIDSKTDIYFNGEGTLSITAAKDGITSKDDIGITNGTITVNAGDDGIVGKDSVQIAGGTITVDAKDDCIKSSKDDDPEKGYVVIDGGEISLSSEEGKGVKSIYVFVMNDGKLTVTKSEEGIQSLNIIQNGGIIDITSDDDGVNVSDKTAARKAAESENKVSMGPGGSGNRADMPKDKASDKMPGGMQPPEGDDNSGRLQPPDHFKGNRKGENMPDAADMKDMPEGMTPPDGGNMPQGMEMRQHGTFENLDGCFVLNGGTLSIHAGGDGVDSNGDILINGGTLYVYGPINHGDGAIDMNGVYEQTGGHVYIPKDAGMMEF
ncbi:MAG: carbohydrate-binding domain-containing protein [Lachnospiraceae bacterium]|nr:carbohydrate-binding domain-containing protein [Lachnospiraceae bacterium]